MKNLKILLAKISGVYGVISLIILMLSKKHGVDTHTLIWESVIILIMYIVAMVATTKEYNAERKAKRKIHKATR